MKRERDMLDCCIGCRNYQRCMVCKFENDVICWRYRVEAVFHWLERLMGGK